MIILCYIFPPLAVLLMGRPFSAMLNLFLTAFLFWIPGIKHALVVYADWRINGQFNRVVDAVNNPAYIKEGRGPQNVTHHHYHGNTDDPRVGANGTVFRRKSQG